MIVILVLIFMVLVLGRKGFHNLIGFPCFLALMAIWFGPSSDAKAPAEKPVKHHAVHVEYRVVKPSPVAGSSLDGEDYPGPEAIDGKIISKREWQKRYGTEEDLLEKVKSLLAMRFIPAG